MTRVVRWCPRQLPAVWLALMAAGLAGCGEGSPGTPSPLVDRYGLEPLPPMVFPAENPPSDARVELGRLIFFDPIQSSGMDVSCGTCHHPDFGMADGRDLPLGPSGVGLGPERELMDPDMLPEGRHSPTVINAGFNRFGAQHTADGFMFWDGRRRRLENLTMLPQRERTEMRGDAYPIEEAVDSVVARLRSIPEYEMLFRTAFPARADSVDAGHLVSTIDSVSTARALAQFIRSLDGSNAPYDRFVAGDESALSDSQKRGLETFYGKAGCAECHSGPMFSDFRFHVVGAKQLGPGFQGTPHEDLGRWAVSRLDSDRYKFRTPTLRNVEHTAPYMHSGGYATLRDVIRFKMRGGRDLEAVPSDRIELTPFELTEAEVQDLLAFLNALSDLPDVALPDRLPSGLEPPRS